MTARALVSPGGWLASLMLGWAMLASVTGCPKAPTEAARGAPERRKTPPATATTSRACATKEAAWISHGGSKEVGALAGRTIVELVLDDTPVVRGDLDRIHGLRDLAVHRSTLFQIGQDLPVFDVAALTGLDELTSLGIELKARGHPRGKTSDVLQNLALLRSLPSLETLTLKLFWPSSAEVYAALPELQLRVLRIDSNREGGRAVIELEKMPRLEALFLGRGVFELEGLHESRLAKLTLNEARLFHPEVLEGSAVRQVLLYGQGPLPMSFLQKDQLRRLLQSPVLESLFIGNASEVDARLFTTVGTSVRRVELECVDLVRSEALRKVGVCELSMVDVTCDGGDHCLQVVPSIPCPDHCMSRCAFRHVQRRRKACHDTMNGTLH